MDFLRFHRADSTTMRLGLQKNSSYKEDYGWAHQYWAHASVIYFQETQASRLSLRRCESTQQSCDVQRQSELRPHDKDRSHRITTCQCGCVEHYDPEAVSRTATMQNTPLPHRSTLHYRTAPHCTTTPQHTALPCCSTPHKHAAAHQTATLQHYHAATHRTTTP